MLKLRKYTKENLEDLSKTGIYKITCLCDNKIYIGSACSIKCPSKTKRGFYGRWNGHINKLENNKHTNNHLQNAWNLYGEDNFVFEILEFTDPETAESREEYFIEKYKSYNHNIGFNILKKSLSNKITTNISTREKISKSLIGKSRPKDINKNLKKPVLQYNLNDNLIAEYKSISEAEKNTPCMRQAIYKCCIGVYKTSNGFKWKYKDSNNNFIKKNNTYRKEIYLFDINMKFLNKFNSLIECSKNLNYCRSTIRFYIDNEIPLNNEYYLKTKM